VELVQRLFRPAMGEAIARAVAFAAIGPGRSAQPVALDVARTLAGVGRRSVCVVDASFGRAALHERAGITRDPGLSTALLTGQTVESLAVAIEENLWLVPGGAPMAAWPGRLPEALLAALQQLAARFDFVLVEAGNLERDFGMPTLMAVGPFIDGAVLVLEAERSRRDIAGDVVARLRAAGVAVLGAVLTHPQRRSE
jgi:MinD-like ATPase involved in chromosome partitioning or flagellar assembly